MDSLTFKNLHKVEVKVYIFENHIYTKLPLSESSIDKLHHDNYKKAWGSVWFLRGQEERAEKRGQQIN